MAVSIAVRDTLNKLENLVAGSMHLPLTGKAMIDEEPLEHLIGDLRRDLPQELERAEEILKERDNIIRNAQLESDKIIKQAQIKADRLVDENDVVVKARETSRMVISQAQQQSNMIVDQAHQEARRLQDDANNYARQVFDQLIDYVQNTFQGVKSAEAGLEQAIQTLQNSKAQMNQQAAKYSYTTIQQSPQQKFSDAQKN